MQKLPFLVPPSANWRGTIGACVTKPQLMIYVAALASKEMEFNPDKIIIHNTAAPNYKQWTESKVYPDRMKGLTAWYRDKCKWQGGPHMFVDTNGFWLFNPLWQRGTHSPSYNQSSWGIEMVGDYDSEPFDKGPGAVIRDNAVHATAVLLNHLKLPANNKTILFHKEDKATTHACPGKNVSKPDFVKRVQEAMKALQQ
jgi:N-acetylmuramoyl-L-alanine amidase-like protein